MGRAILLTPAGGAAIAVVRLVGPSVGPFLQKHFTKPAREGRCVHGTLVDGPRVIDDPVVVLHAGGAVADVNLHGGPWVVRSMLELALREGFDVVERVEMPLPDEAVDAETELGREVLRYLPMARTELALRTLLAQEEAWRAIGGWVGPVGSASADRLLIPRNVNENNRSAEADPTLDVRSVLEDRGLYWLLHAPRVAIVGVPNVGKSTLANQLFAQERSITADVPGTTRDWVGEIANLDGLAVMLVDTPGVRQTQDAIEREAIERSREQVGAADLVVVVLDATRDLSEQRDLLAAYPSALRVVNKVDRPKAWDVPDDGGWIQTVATTGSGVDRLRDAIKRQFLGSGPFDVNQPRWWTRRQREALERAGRPANK